MFTIKWIHLNVTYEKARAFWEYIIQRSCVRGVHHPLCDAHMSNVMNLFMYAFRRFFVYYLYLLTIVVPMLNIFWSILDD
jgi:hypothetical protein